MPDTDSKNLWPLRNGRTEENRDHVHSCLGDWRCVVTRSHRYVTGFKDDPDILVNLANDPWEDHNMAESNKAIIKEML